MHFGRRRRLLWLPFVVGTVLSASCRYGYEEHRDALTLGDAGSDAQAAQAGVSSSAGSSGTGDSRNAGGSAGSVSGSPAAAGAGASALGQLGNGGDGGIPGDGGSGGDGSAPPPCSIPLSNTDSLLLFENQTANRTYRIDWIGYDCTPITFWDRLAPGEQWGVTTYAGHSWLAVDLAGGPNVSVVYPSGPSSFTFVLR